MNITVPLKKKKWYNFNNYTIISEYMLRHDINKSPSKMQVDVPI